MRKVLVVLCLLATSAVTAADKPPTDFLAAIQTAIERNGGACDGFYRYARGNALPDAWLQQTPYVWGKKPEDVLAGGHSRWLVEAIEETIGKATTVVDITTLAPPPSGVFESAIVRGLRRIAKTGKPVVVRILVGTWITGPPFHPDEYLGKLGRQIEDIPGTNMIIYVANQRTDLHSWNHSKIVQVDGRYLLTGGHNLWPDDYLGAQPVHDVSMLVEGPAAFAAFSFANELWNYVRYCNSGHFCGYQGPSYRWTVGHIVKEVPAGVALSESPAAGNVPMIAIARAGSNLTSCGKDRNPSDTAMVAVLDHAETSIRFSQQDMILGMCGKPGRTFWREGMIALSRAVARGVDVQMVLSNSWARAGDGSQPYSTCVSAKETWDTLADVMEQMTKLPASKVRELMRKHVHIATLRFGPENTSAWKNGWTFANHAKMMIVDDSVFYIGSSNFYSTNLQEFGLFVQSPPAIQTLLKDYWDPMWTYSKVTEYIPPK